MKEAARSWTGPWRLRDKDFVEVEDVQVESRKCAMASRPPINLHSVVMTAFQIALPTESSHYIRFKHLGIKLLVDYSKRPSRGRAAT
jgi:hypothetical protein